jgi:hypothetical protein
MCINLILGLQMNISKNYMAIFYTLTLVGCASITQGTSQVLTFNLEPKETMCQATRDGDGTLGSITYQNPTLNISPFIIFGGAFNIVK